MKKIVFTLSFLLSISLAIGQSKTIVQGNGVRFFNNFKNNTGRLDKNKLSVAGKEVEVKITYSSENDIIGTLKGRGSFLSLQKSGNNIKGQLVLADTDKVAYVYNTDSKGNITITEVNINEVLCVSYKGNSAHNSERIGNINAAPIGTLESLPGCPNVIMLDFDGFNLPAGTPWNSGAARTINGVNYTDVQQETIWSNIKEDYSPFQVNITTSEAVYQAASPTKRMKVVITRDEVTPGGGVAIVGSFGSERTKCCWVYPNKLAESLLSVAEASSHEAGHTLGLKHDGAPSTPDYYAGHNGWAPIMGDSYRSFVTQWSKGEYTGANNLQDDLASISSYLSYKTDDHGNTNATATEIKYTLDNTGTAIVDAASNAGIIERNTDVDVFHFYLSGGQINLLIKPTGTPRCNLDIQATIYDKSGVLVQRYTTTHSAGSSTVPTSVINGFTINKSLPKGDYYIEIDGIGSGDPKTGWSDYNSMGQYAISGTIIGIEQKSYDIGLVAINNVFAMNCGNKITPTLQVMNNGKVALTSFDAEVFIDGVSKGIQKMSGTMASGETKDFSLTPISITTFGNKTLKIVISNPNGFADEIAVNNELTKAFTIGDGGLYQFSISTLSKDKTMTWKVTSAGAAVTDNTKNSAVVVSDKEVTGFCLANDKCYSFEVTKAFKENTCAIYPAWNSTTQYKVGDIVVYQGNVYKANSAIWTVDPTTAWYDLVGPCPVVNVNDSFIFTEMATNKVISNIKYSAYINPYKIDFCSATSTTTGIDDSNLEQIGLLYPNPVHDVLNINSSNELSQIVILNTLGQIVYQSENAKSIQSIHIESFANGMYFFTGLLNNGKKITQKFTKY